MALSRRASKKSDREPTQATNMESKEVAEWTNAAAFFEEVVTPVYMAVQSKGSFLPDDLPRIHLLTLR